MKRSMKKSGRSAWHALIVSGIALIAVTTASAQNVQTLSMDEAIVIATKNNQGLQIARLEMENADAQVDEALGTAYPKVDVNARYTRNIQRPVFFFPGDDGVVRPIQIGSKNALAGDITVNQIVFNSAVFNGPGTARTYAQVTREQLRSQANGVVFQVQQAYYGALFAREVKRVNEVLLGNAEANYKNTKVLFDAGLRAEFDALRAEVTVANQRPLVVEAQNTYQTALDNLKLLLGYDSPDQVELELSGNLPDPTTEAGTVEGFVAAANRLTASNPQLETLRLGTEVNRQLISINKSDYLPTVAFFGTWKLEGQADNFSFDFQPSAFAGLNLSLNLYSGGQTEAKVKQAEVAYDKSRFQLAQAETALKTQLETTLRQINYARQRIEASERTIGQAERAYSIATATYKAGTGTQLQINDADLALAQARLNRLNAIYDYAIATARLQYLIGDQVKLSGDDVQYQSR